VGTNAFWHAILRAGVLNFHPLYSRYLTSGPDQVKNRRVLDPVIHVAAFSTGRHDARLAHGHEVLGDVGLPHAQASFQVADAGFPQTNRLQNAQAGGQSQRVQYIGDLLRRCAVSLCKHIHLFEYIVGVQRPSYE